jgi:two-component system, LytTR family, response regulator
VATIRAVIVDDEALARTYLRELLADHPEVAIVAECENGFEAVKAVAAHDPDLLFLDIQMPKLDGFEVLELLDPAPQVIFVTAYDEYALKAFEVHAVDYLLKPFRPERLAEALDRVAAPERPKFPAAKLAADARPQGRYLERIATRDGNAVHVVPVDELDYVQAQDDYVELHTQGMSHLKHQTLQSLCDQLDPTRFVRIHRSTLVNLERIARIEPWTKDTKLVVLTDGTELTASRSGYKRLQEAMETGA